MYRDEAPATDVTAYDGFTVRVARVRDTNQVTLNAYGEGRDHHEDYDAQQ